MDTGRPDASDGTRTPATEPTQPRRINVAVNEEMVRALDLVIQREGVTLTEAVRRLISYGEFVYRTIKVDNAEILVRTSESTKEIILV